MMSFAKRLKDRIKGEYNQISSMAPSQVKSYIKNDPLYSIEAIGGMVAPVKRIHPEDVKKMIGFIDYARLKQPFNHAMELDASRIAEHYKTAMPKTVSGLANTFDNILARMKQKGKI